MEEEINKSVVALNAGGVLLYPTDTILGLGCRADDMAAVDKIYAIKQRESSKSMILLVSSVVMLSKYIDDIPLSVFEIIEKAIKPTTIIYKNPKNIAKNLIAEDNTIAIRVVKNSFCIKLIEKLDCPLVSTSANISGQEYVHSIKKMNEGILCNVDYIVNLPLEKQNLQVSTILKVSDDNQIEIIRA
ncbi:MAG: threonylcarbamoyl-AMP synthase [Flavobacteriaceae bacterium]|nr:threonylcarbamoyl-AMP synthase [Flavobacteriaceae bacterium]